MANINYVISAVDNFSNTFNKLTKKQEQVFGAARKLGKTMMATGAITATALGGTVKVAADFEKSMSKVGAISGATESEMKLLSETARKLGAETAFSAKEAADGMSFLAMAGYEVNDIVAAMPGLLNTASAGNLDLARTADIVSNVMSGFQMEASATGDVADVLAKTMTSANVDMEMLGDTMSYVAPIASSAGMSLEEMAAAAGILGNAGIQGSKAGTTLRGAITRLAAPTGQAASLMDELGISVTDSQGAMLPLADILGQLEQATAGMGDAQKLATLKILAGEEAASGLMVLLNEGAGTLAEFTGELENAGGTAQEIADKQLDNLSGQLTILKSGLEGAAISIGSALTPAVSQLVEWIQSAVDWFNNLPEGLQQNIALFTALASVASILGGFLLVLIGYLPRIAQGFSLIASAVGLSTKGLFALMAGSAGIIAIIAAIGFAVYQAYQRFEGFRNVVDTVVTFLRDVFVVAFEFVKTQVSAIWTALTDFLSEKIAYIKSFFEENGEQMLEAFTNIWNAIKSVIEAVMPIITTVFKTGWTVIKTLVQTTWDAIKRIISGAIDVVLGIIKTFISIFTGDWSGVWEGIKQIASGAINAVIGFIQVGFVGRAVKIIRSALTAARNIVRSMFNGMRNIVRSITTSIRNVISSGWNKAVSFLKGINLLSIGKSIISGLVKGIKSKISAVTNAVKKIGSTITGKVKGILGINSPSKVTMEFGEWTTEGLAIGMEDTLRMVDKATQKVADAATIQPEDPSPKPFVKSFDTRGVGGGSNRQDSDDVFEVTIPIYVDGQEVDRKTIRRTSEEMRRMSRNSRRAKGVEA